MSSVTNPVIVPPYDLPHPDLAIADALRARIAELKKIEKHLALSKMRYTPQGLQRWLAVSASGERKRT